MEQGTVNRDSEQGTGNREQGQGRGEQGQASSGGTEKQQFEEQQLVARVEKEVRNTSEGTRYLEWRN
jgi:hypothetical protein